MTAPIRSLAIDDVALAYRSAGSGPAVLCVQGVGVAGDGWRPQVEALAARYRVLTFDNRGVGATPSKASGSPPAASKSASSCWSAAASNRSSKCPTSSVTAPRARARCPGREIG